MEQSSGGEVDSAGSGDPCPWPVRSHPHERAHLQGTGPNQRSHRLCGEFRVWGFAPERSLGLSETS